jgi:tetratricopeptide (TPR) repeat protein
MSRHLVPALVLALAAGPLFGQPAAQPRSARTAFDPYRANIDAGLRLYTDPAVQAELKLTDEQKAKLAKIPDDLLAKHKDEIAKETAADKEAVDKQMAQQVDIEKKLDALVEKTLTVEQRKRLGQLVVQAMGVSAFREADVAKALALPDGYQTKLNEIQQANRDKMLKEVPNVNTFPPSLPPEERQKVQEAQRKMTRDTFDQFVETFTAEQKKAWKELTGEPSETIANPAGTTSGGFVGRGFFFRSQRSSAQASLLTNEKALAELKVEKPARDALGEGMKALQAESQSTLGRDFELRANNIQRTIGGEAGALAAAMLTAPQAKRLEQIRFHLNGTQVFSATTFSPVTFTSTGGFGGGGRPAEAGPLTKLTLTPAQVKKIDAVLADATAKMRELGPQRGGFGFVGNQPLTEAQKKALEAQEKAQAEYRSKLNAIEQKALADITATFDAGQAAVWKEFTGEPFDVSKLTTTSAPFGPRGAAGFGGGGGSRGAAPATIVNLWSREAALKLNRGEYAAVLATYDEAIRLAPTNTMFKLSKARLLASCPSEWVRDGKQGVELMTKVMAETKEPTYSHYDVLAMAHAEAGQFDEAVKAQEKAISLLPPPANPDDMGLSNLRGALKPQYEARLKLYQEKKPYRTELPQPRQPRGER